MRRLDLQCVDSLHGDQEVLHWHCLRIVISAMMVIYDEQNVILAITVFNLRHLIKLQLYDSMIFSTVSQPVYNSFSTLGNMHGLF